MSEIETAASVPPVLPVIPAVNQPVKLPRPTLSIVTVVAVILLIGLAFGSYQLGKSQRLNTTTPITNSPTADWKTYTNQEPGFSIDYPNAWNRGDKKTADGYVVVLTPASVDKIGFQVQAVYIRVQNNTKHITSKEYYTEVLKPFQVGSVCTNPLINTNVPSSLKNLDITIIEGMCGVLSQGPRMIVTRDNYLVDVSSSFIDQVDNNLIYQILATFKFIDQNPKGAFCGGIAGTPCPKGYKCQLEGRYPDAGGTCVLN